MNNDEINRLLADHATERMIKLLMGADARFDRFKWLAHRVLLGDATAAREVVLERIGGLCDPGLRLSILASWVETMCNLIDWERVGAALSRRAADEVSPG